jgi:Mg-chelatase subunit ChlD
MNPVHTWILLDRSGSMASIADDVVGGFNEFLDRQRQLEGEARVTLAQFDNEDPFEVLIDGVPLREVTHLSRAAYRPRGMTPLHDACARMISTVDADIAERADLGLEREDQVVLIITDGAENASTEHTRATVFELIASRKERGWVFSFLGADQDSFAEGGSVGVAAANIANWDKTAAGTKAMWERTSKSVEAHRAKSSVERFESIGEFLAKEDGED